MSMMTWAKVTRESACLTASGSVEWRNAHPFVMETMRRWIIKMVEGLNIVHLDTRQLLNFFICEK